MKRGTGMLEGENAAAVPMRHPTPTDPAALVASWATDASTSGLRYLAGEAAARDAEAMTRLVAIVARGFVPASADEQATATALIRAVTTKRRTTEPLCVS